MLFPSEVFLFVFLPIVVTVYYAFLRKTTVAKNLFLLAASLFFYAWGEPVYVFLMIGTIIFNWIFGILVDKFRNNKIIVKLVFVLMILVNLGILGWFKYAGFTVLQINRFLHTAINVPVVALPIGISFFTFQAMSYVIDVYRERGKVQYNLFYVGLYVSLFPQLIAGPIVRYETIADQIENRKENFSDFSAGVTRFCIGLGKKVLVANNMAVIADNAFALIINGEFQASMGMAWLGAIAYTLQISMLEQGKISLTYSEEIPDYIESLKHSMVMADQATMEPLKEFISTLEKAEEEDARKLVARFERNVRHTKEN